MSDTCQTPGCGHGQWTHQAQVQKPYGECEALIEDGLHGMCPCTRYTNADERFWSKVDKTGECWEWTAAKLEAGYGVFRHADGRTVKAHRYAYELVVGHIPEGLVIDHLCKNKSCVNPEHLEPVTSAENTMRGNGPTAVNARKTHCPRGHEYTDENTWVSDKGYRYCRTCKGGTAPTETVSEPSAETIDRLMAREQVLADAEAAWCAWRQDIPYLSHSAQPSEWDVFLAGFLKGRGLND